VLVCDLVASTEIAEQIGDEPLWDLLLEYQDACSEVIHRYDGTVYKRMGDGLLALFGIPRAHEDDAPRAVHAALALVAAVGRLAAGIRKRHNVDLALRVGVHTGDVVVGEIGGSLEVAGKAVHLADRLQSLAESNGVIISGDTAGLLGDSFELHSRGEVDLRGLSQAAMSYDVIRARDVASIVTSKPVAMVGRAEERSAVGAAWKKVVSGGAHTMLITGDAGIGKSRLARFARDHASREGGVPLEGECSPYHADVPFHVIGRMISGHMALDPSAGSSERIVGLADALTAAGVDPTHAVPLLAPLLSLDPDENYQTSELSPREVAAETIDVILDWWSGLAAKEARAIVIEDLHNADPSTVELVGQATSRGLGPGTFLILTSRPMPGLLAVGEGDIIELEPLPSDEAMELMEALSPDAGSANEDLVQRSGGNPLFIRELSQARSKSSGDVPGGLRDLLMARLDDAGDLELAQLASVVGTTIDPYLLEAVAGNGNLADRVENLVDKGILTHHNDHKGRRLRFVHQLLGETAYESLPTRHRQSVHSTLADVYLSDEGGLAQASLAALHLDRSGRHAEAAEAYLEAADAASSRGASSEALRHLVRTQEIADEELTHEEGHEFKRVAVLRTSFVLVAKEGFGSDAANRAVAKALELAPPDSLMHSAGPRIGAFAQATILGQRSEAEEIISSMEADLEDASASDRIQVEAEIVSARALHDFGLARFTASRLSFESALELYQGAPRHGAPWPDWPLPTSLPATANAQLIPIYWVQGDRSLSEEAARRAKVSAEQLTPPMDAFNMAYAIGYVGWTHLLDHAVPDARAALREQGDIGRESGFAMWESLAEAFGAVAAAQLEPTTEMADEAATRRDHAAMNAGSSFQPYLIAAEAEIRLRAGQRERALELIEESLALAAATSEYIYLPETHRLRAAARSDPDEARQDLNVALEISESQDAHVYSLRALLDMGALPDPHSNDLGDRVNVVLLAMSEPESYPENAQAIEFLAGRE